MPSRKKNIQHDAIVQRFSNQLREKRLARGMSQAELARKASVTTNYISRLETGGAAPGIDLVARLADALQTPIVELLESETMDELKAVRARAQTLFDALIESEDQPLLILLIQLLTRLGECSNR